MVSQRQSVLVFPCGSEVGLELGKALSHSRFFNLIGGSSVADHGSFFFPHHIDGLPFVGDAGLLPAVQRIIEDRRIAFIFPAHDGAVTLFSQWEQQGALGPARVVSSTYETCKVVRSKLQTYSLFEGVIPTPKIYGSAAEVPGYPVFLKPDVGQGSKGTFKAICLADIEYQQAKDPTLLILEHLPGREYTVDCFTDRHGALRFAEGRQRNRISNGISVNTAKTKDARFGEWADKINRTLRFSGAWFFQVKARESGEFVLLEIGARIAGTSCYHRASGVNLPLLSLFDKMGHDITIAENNVALEMDRQLQNRYKFDYDFRDVYVDFDDTLVEEDKVNHRILAVLYRFKFEGKKLHLITRHFANHREEVRVALKKVFVDPLLFDEIVDVPSVDRKSSHVAKECAIFIDDSFRERNDVSGELGIPVFDVNQMIEVFG